MHVRACVRACVHACTSCASLRSSSWLALPRPRPPLPLQAQVYRQSDEDMVARLNAIRCGSDVDSRASLEHLSAACSRQLPEDGGIKPTHIYATNKEVRRELMEQAIVYYILDHAMHNRELSEDGGIKPTHIYATNKEVCES